MLLVTATGGILEPFGVLVALTWVVLSRTPWPELGFVRPKSWVRTLAVGFVAGAALKILMKALVMPLLGAPAINPTYHYLANNSAALPSMLVDVTLGAGFGEETVYRGFLFERFRKLLGTSTRATVSIVLLTSVVFGLIHLPGQGIYGAQQATIVGLVVGTVFAVTRCIWPVVFMHAAFDVTAVLMIYWNLESRVAHLIFH